MSGASVESASTELLIRAMHAYDGVAGDPGRFAPVAAAVVREARRAADVEALVVGLRARAWAERARRQNVRARRLLDEAVRLAQRAGLTHRLTEVLVSRAAITLELGKVAAALRDLDRAGSGNGSPGPHLEFMRAVLLHNLGRLGPAADAYHRVLADPGATLDNQGSAATNLALIASDRGQFEESLRHLDHAERLAAEVGLSLYAFAAQNRGIVLAQAGRLTESVAQFDRAVALFTKAGVPLGEHLMEHADVLIELRLLPEAREAAAGAAAELDAGGVQLLAAEARLALARAALLAGDAGTARDEAEHAAALFRRQRRTAWVARTVVLVAEASLLDGGGPPELPARTRRAAGFLERAGMPSAAAAAHLVAGRLAARLERPALAQRYFRRAGELAQRGSILLRVRGRLAVAHAERLAGRDELVLRHCRAGLADLARHREALGSTELRALASGHGVELGRMGLEVLLRAGSAEPVLLWMERTRAAALLTVEPPAPEAVRDELAELRAVHLELAQALRETGVEPAGLRARQEAAEARVRRATWRRTVTSVDHTAQVRSIAQLRQRLNGSVLVSFGSLGDQLFAVVLAPRATRLVRLGPIAPLHFERDALLFALRRLARPGRTSGTMRASAEHAVRRLTELLIEPLEVPADVPLIVLPSSRISRLPWSVLHRGPVLVAPSAALWARTRETEPVGPAEVVLVAGPRLDGAVDEVAAVGGLYREVTVLAPPASTVAATVAALGRAGLAHLACHGRLRADNPSFSALELVDGQLTVHELDRRGIAPHRVVLAACDSAAEVSFDGDELLGFVSALLARGTAGLVASVVEVGDVEAVDLMRGLHERLARGDSMAAALHTARTALDLGDPRQFVNWCAFTAFGAG